MKKLIEKNKSKSEVYSFVESRSVLRGTTNYGYCWKDGNPVIVSSDRDEAMDHLLAIMRKEKTQHDRIIATASAHAIEVEDLEPDEVLTEPEEPENV